MGNNKFADCSYNEGLKKFIDNQTQKSVNTGEIYLTAGGYYQEEYIALFEELTSSKNTDIVDGKNGEEYVDFIAELFFNELLKKYPDKYFPFNKIVSVTLPSQMIAKAMHKILKRKQEDTSDLFFYTNNEKKQYSLKLPKLIRLSSYYSFSKEIQFKNIEPNDNVLIVNDVISTGGLLSDINESISSIKLKNDNFTRANITCVLSVVDSRVPDSDLNLDIHKRSTYFNNSSAGLNESNFITLEHRKILKYKENPSVEKILIRINPILNARITMETKHSEEDKIVFKESAYFLEYIPKNAMTIGHFKENSLHHQYFFRPEVLFSESETNIKNNGITLVRKLYKEIRAKEEKYDLQFVINSTIAHFNSFEEIIKDNSQTQDLKVNKLKEEFLSMANKAKRIIKSKKAHESTRSQLLAEDDYVFYPVFSGIESDELVNKLHEIFNVNYSNIKPLQRFDTNKGWRFIVPQKNYNTRLKGKKVVLLDMGSFTGDSIIQMIDALCVFELKKIIVISLIGRLEDFNREFFSRIRELKVKILKPNEKVLSFNQNSRTPINIYFGTNLHFPASRSENVCEHCEEIKMLEIYREKFKEFNISGALKYIEHRIKTLNVIDVSQIEILCPDYFPRIKGNNSEKNYDIHTFFTIRDYLGKIDGYRFYTDYYIFFDKIDEIVEDYKKNIEAIIAITLHEKHLAKTIENQLPDVKEKVLIYIRRIINDDLNFEDLFYTWGILPILESYFLYNDANYIFKKENLTLLLNFVSSKCSANSLEFNFIEYKMAEAYYNNKKDKSYFQNQFIKSIKEIWLDIEDSNIEYKSIISKINRIIINDTIVEGKEEVKAFYKIFKMYDSASGYKPSHTDFGISIDNLKTLIVAQNIHHNTEDSVFISDIHLAFEEVKQSLSGLLSNIEKVSSYLKGVNIVLPTKCHPEYFSDDIPLKRHLNDIDELLKNPNKENILKIRDILDTIQNEYFQISQVKQNFYSIWKDCFHISVIRILKNFDGSINDVDFKIYIGEKKYHKLIKTKLKSFKIIPEESYEECGVKIFPFFLIIICKELLDNLFKHAKGADVKITISNVQKETGVKYTEFIFSQNIGAKGKPVRGLHSVQKIVEDFSGEFHYDDKQPNELIIKIIIPITQYKQ